MESNAAWLLWHTAQRHPARPAIVEGRTTTDHETLRRRAAGIAVALAARGVVPGERIGILLDRGAPAAAAFFGVLAAGGVAVVINEALRPRQIEHQLAHAGARVLLTEAALLARLPRPLQTGCSVVECAEIAVDATGTLVPVSRRGDDPAQIVYTSGSTGAPKGVTVGHGNLRSVARTVIDYLGIVPTDRIAGLLPFASVYGMNQLLCAAGSGACLVVDRSVLPPAIVAGLRTAEVTVLAAVPPLWMRLLSGGFRDIALPDLRVMTNAGGHLPVEMVRALRGAHPEARLYLMYGLTEVLRSTYLPPEEVDRRPDSIGRPIPGAKVWVVDEQDRPVPPGMVGELVHHGPTVTLGYWNDPTLTAQVFRPLPGLTRGNERPVHSGDLVRQDEAGFLYFVSRADRIIKTMGYRVGPDEVVDVLMASGEVAEAEVVGAPDPVWGARIVAHVVLAPGGSLPGLRSYCERELPRHMQPAHYDVHDAMPLLASGKHDLPALEALPAQ